jgi:hypothetical protein
MFINIKRGGLFIIVYKVGNKFITICKYNNKVLIKYLRGVFY